MIMCIRYLVLAMLCYLAWRETHAVSLTCLLVILCLHTEMLNRFCAEIIEVAKKLTETLEEK